MFIPLVKIHVRFFADQVRVATADTLDFGESVHDFLFSINVGIKKTEDKLEVRLLPRYERYS